MPVSGSPTMRRVPAEGRSSPAATLSNVDLPQPVGPTTETNSPSPIESVTSFTAVYAPCPPRAANVQVIPSRETAAVTLLVLCRRLLCEGIVESLREVHLARGHDRRLELFEDLVDVLRR